MLHIGRRTLSDGKHNVLITKQYTRPLSHLMMTSTSSVFCFRWTAQAKSRYSNGVHFSRLSFTYRRHMYQVNMSEPSGEGGYREGGGEAETGGTRTSSGGGREGREASQRSGGRGTAMNDSGSRIPNGEAPAGGSPRATRGRPGNGTRPRAFLGDSRGGMACGVCVVTLQLGLQAMRFPCAQGCHMIHARCVVETLARSVAPASLRCPTVNCGVQHPRRDALEAAVQADPGLRNQAGRMRGGTIGDEDLSSRGVWYGWDHNSLGIRPPLDAVSLDDLGQRFASGKSTATVGRSTCAPECSCDWHPQPCYRRAPIEPGLGDAELARAGD